MGNYQYISIYLKDGSTVSFCKPYNYFDKGIITDNMEKAKEDELVCFRSRLGDDLLIPKSNISFIRISSKNSNESIKYEREESEYESINSSL